MDCVRCSWPSPCLCRIQTRASHDNALLHVPPHRWQDLWMDGRRHRHNISGLYHVWRLYKLGTGCYAAQCRCPSPRKFSRGQHLESNYHYLVRNGLCYRLGHQWTKTGHPTPKRDLFCLRRVHYDARVLLWLSMAHTELARPEHWLLHANCCPTWLPHRRLRSTRKCTWSQGKSWVDGRMDHFLLGMVDCLVTLRWHVHRKDIQRKNH